MIVSRTFDHNLARRELREVLLEAADALSIEEEAVPHSFQTDRLLDFARKLTQKRALSKEPELREDLLARTGITAFLNKDPDLGRTCFERGLRLAEEGPDSSRFLYLSAVYEDYHQRNFVTARAKLEEALAGAELARRLRTEIRIALGRTCRNLGELTLAAQHYNDVIEIGVGEYRPTALHFLAMVRLREKDFPEAKRLAREALQTADAKTDPTLPLSIRSTFGDIALEKGDLAEAARLYQAAATELDRILAVHSAAKTYANLGTAYRRLGQYGSALDAYASAVRFYTIEGQRALLSQIFRNIAICFAAMADIESARGAYDYAVKLAREIGSPELELLALTKALEQADTLGLQPKTVGHALGRCKAIVARSKTGLSATALQRLATSALSFVGSSIKAPEERKPPAFGTTSERLARLIVPTDVLSREFKEALGSKLELPSAPSRDAIESFLLLFTGDQFKHADYAGEFSIYDRHAKHHLKALRDRKVIELHGERKAAAYTLSFHH